MTGERQVCVLMMAGVCNDDGRSVQSWGAWRPRAAGEKSGSRCDTSDLYIKVANDLSLYVGRSLSVLVMAV